jgi:hypothetical protein
MVEAKQFNDATGVLHGRPAAGSASALYGRLCLGAVGFCKCASHTHTDTHSHTNTHTRTRNLHVRCSRRGHRQKPGYVRLEHQPGRRNHGVLR